MLGNNNGSGMGRVLAQSAVAVPLTGSTSETTLATITIPAGAMGANGRVEIKAHYTFTNSANTKTLKVKFGGNNYASAAQTTATPYRQFAFVANCNSAASQYGEAELLGASAIAHTTTTTSLDTTASVDIVITGQLALGTETITLVSYQVILYPKG